MEHISEMRPSPKLPDVIVSLEGESYAIIGRVLRAMRDAGVHAGWRDQFVVEATQGDRDDLLRVCRRWVVEL